MLTPVDIQQKHFKSGLGYDKKDVNAFFEEVLKSYSELYKSNAELKDKVMTLNDTVQHYKVTESEMSKSLLLAEKNQEESKTNAERTAKNIEAEARSRAHEIIKDAQNECESLQQAIAELTSDYAEYKIKFGELIQEHLRFLENHDFHKEAKVNPEYTSAKEEHKEERVREEEKPIKPSGGLSIKTSKSNSSNVYGSTLGGSGIDPFSEIFGDI